MPDVSSTSWLVAPIAGPLALALPAFVFGGRWAARLGLAAAVIVTISVGAVTAHVWRDGPQTHPLGSWPAPLGIALYADGLSCVMLWMSAVVGAVVSIYAVEYYREPAHDNQERGSQEKRSGLAPFWPLWMMLWSALHALFLSRDVFNLYVTLELLTLAAIGWVAAAGTREAVRAALRYLLAALAGSLLYLAGVALLYGAYGVLDIATLHAAATPDRTLQAALVLAMLGLMLKTALFPFHFWLPPAHGSAPAPASAVLSGLVVKGSFYILLRLWFDLFPDELTRPVGWLPAVFGAAAIVWGSLQALVAERLKMLIAYSTIAQLGYLFLVFDLARPGSDSGDAAWTAGVLYTLAHALAKSSLFLSAGAILHVAGHDRIRDLPGVSRRMPVTFFAMGIASVSLMGLPPTGAFVAKWMLLNASIAAGRFGLVVVIIGGGLLAAAYLFRPLAAAFAEPDGEAARSLRPPPSLMEYTSLGLAIGSLALGMLILPLAHLLEIGSPFSPDSQEGWT